MNFESPDKYFKTETPDRVEMQENKKGNVAVIAIIIAIVALTASVFTWILMKKSQTPVQETAVIQSAPAEKTQPTAPDPVAQQKVNNPLSENTKQALDRKALQDAVFTTLCKEAPPAKYLAPEEITDRWYSTCEDNRIDIDKVDVSQKAAKGKRFEKDAWDWIAWQKDDGKWTVLVSADGFNCKELDNVPSQYADFFKDVIYQFGNKYCY